MPAIGDFLHGDAVASQDRQSHLHIGPGDGLSGDGNVRVPRQQRQRQQHTGNQLGRLISRQRPVARCQRAGQGKALLRAPQAQIPGDRTREQPVGAGEHRVGAAKGHEQRQQKAQGAAAVAAVHQRRRGGQAGQSPVGRQHILCRVGRQLRDLARQKPADQLAVQQAFGGRHRDGAPQRRRRQ